MAGVSNSMVHRIKNSVLKEQLDSGFRSNSVLKEQLDSGFGSNSVLKEQLDSGFRSNSVLKEQLGSGFGSNSVLKEQLDIEKPIKEIINLSLKDRLKVCIRIIKG